MASKTTQLPEVWMRLHDRERLVKRMRRNGVSTRRLAHVAGYSSHAYIARLLHGEINKLPVERAIRIALYLGQDIDDLFEPDGSTGARHTDQERCAA